jgi:hypothetical protein
MSGRLLELVRSEFRKARDADNEAMFLASMHRLVSGLPHRNRLLVLSCAATFQQFAAPHEHATFTLLSMALFWKWEDTVIWLLRQGVSSGPLAVTVDGDNVNVRSSLICLLEHFNADDPKCIRCLKLVLQNTPEVYDLHCVLGYSGFAPATWPLDWPTPWCGPCIPSGSGNGNGGWGVVPASCGCVPSQCPWAPPPPTSSLSCVCSCRWCMHT